MDQQSGIMSVNDLLPEIVVFNAHDGTASFQLHAGIFRLVCENGMIVAESTLAAHRIRHSGKMVEEAIEAAYQIVEETPKVFHEIERYRAISLDTEEQGIFAKSALTLRWPEEDNRPYLPDQMLSARRRDDQGTDLWTVFNRIQENLLRGGMRGRKRNAFGRLQRSTARAIKSVSEDLRINKALWTLMERFAELKS